MAKKNPLFELINELHKGSTKELFATNFSKLNILGLELLLDKTKQFDGISKTKYLTYINAFFEDKKSNNIKELDCKPIVCLRCKKGCSGYIFLDNIQKIYYSFIVEEENGKIIDLKECSKFETNISLDEFKHLFVREFPVF